MQQLQLKISGLYTHASDLAGAPEGALSIADDVVIDKDQIAEPRRGFNKAFGGFSDASYRANKLFFYQDYLLSHYSTNLLAYYSLKLDTPSAAFASSGAWTATSGTYTGPGTEKVRATEANQNFYFTTAGGVYKLDAYNSTPVKSGAYKALDASASVSVSTSTWLTTDYRTAYRIVWGYRDANNNLILGAPSQRTSFKNTAGAEKAVTLRITLPSGVTTSWFYQVYRAAAVSNAGVLNTEPSDEMGLVYEANPSAGDITNKYLDVDDITPDVLRGATLYTSASQQGLASGNEQAPMCNDIAVFKNTLFYANTTSKNRYYLTVLAAGGTSGIQINDTLTIGGVVLTAKAAELITSGQFRTFTASTFTFVDAAVSVANDTISSTGHVLQDGDAITLTNTGGALPAGLTAGTTYYVRDSAAPLFKLATAAGGTAVNITAAAGGGTHTLTFGGSASQNIRDTSLSIVRVLNRYASSTVYAYYLSGPDDLPGKILIEERSIGGAVFPVISSRAACWSPALPSSGAAQSSTNDRRKHGLSYSKPSEPEAVPLTNNFFCGSASEDILRIVPLRDSLFIFKTDGIYRLSGEDTASFRVDLFDSTARLLAPESAAVLNNQIFCLTDQGVVSVTESGVQVRSRPIEATLNALQGSSYSVLRNESFGIGYETERKYILFVPRLPGDTSPSQAFVFNTFTNSWTRWVLSKKCGLVNPGDDKLYLGPSNSEFANQERKALDFTDYADYSFATTISATTSLSLTLSGSDNISVGDVIYQSATVYSIVSAVDTSTGIVTLSFSASFATTTASVLKAIPSKIAWIPFTAANPGMLKHFREVSLLFKRDYVGDGTIVFTSDSSPAAETEVIAGTALGQWGLFTWGGTTWGGNGGHSLIRAYVPRNKQRCTQLTIEFRHATAFTNYQLNGASIIANTGSERVVV